MEVLPLNQIFEVTYGNKFDLKNMSLVKSGVAFIGRTAKNNGVVAFVENNGVLPYPPGLITVNLGGAVLESFLQPQNFYTAQNIAILKPKRTMSEEEKLFYCLAIRANKFRYGAFGREANRTLRTLEVPKAVPGKFLNIQTRLPSPQAGTKEKVSLQDRSWGWFVLEDLFDIKRAKGLPRNI